MLPEKTLVPTGKDSCVNCGEILNTPYCPTCGEKNDIPKITLNSITEEAISSFVEMDRGFLYNVKTMLWSPKTLVYAYLRGKRKGVFNPITFLVVCITIYLLVERIPSIFNFYAPNSYDHQEQSAYKFGVQTGIFIRNNFKFIFVLCMFPLAFATKTVFSKYNYWENIAIAAFILGQSILLSGLLYLLTGFNLLFNPFLYLTIAWYTYRIFKTEHNQKDMWILTFTSAFLFGVLLIAGLGIIGIVLSIFN
ncbi:DUF3667 domain-containing protein [Croceivirga radicis]|uniref:DUF3667 domain-containing protein n=1 Tax=Croceivirga radicis TaxID=1929488 RepID=UPI000255B365|nr:DUF3667 domain-containing protein [Croceivirga radicis]